MRSLIVLLFLLSGYAATFAQVSVQVFDTRGEPLVGATVLLSPTSTGLSKANPQQVGSFTDAEGRAEVEPTTAGDYVLQVSYTGYPTLRKSLPGLSPSTALNVGQLVMREDATLLAEAQVVAVRARPNDPFAFTNVDAESLAEANGGQDIPALLRRLPGTVTTSDAGTGIGYSGLRIRGSDATRINVTINGVPLNDAESQGVFWVNMPDFISSTSSLQVQRGVGQSTYGAGSFGANINAVTDVPSTEPRIVAELAGGSFKTGRAMLKASTGQLAGGFSAEGRLSYITSDGWVDRASSRLGAAYLGTSWAPTQKDHFQLIGWTGKERTYQSWYGIPLSYAQDAELQTFNPAGDQRDGTFYEDQVDNYRQSHAQALYSHQTDGGLLLQLTGHYTRGLGYYEEWRNGASIGSFIPGPGYDTLAADLVRRLWLDNHFYGGIATVSGQLSPKLHLTASAGINEYRGGHYGTVPELGEVPDFVRDDYDAERRYYDNDARKLSANTFAKATYDLTPSLSAYADVQFRHLRYSFEGIDRTAAVLPQDANFTFFNPKAGVSLKEVFGGSAFASVAVGHREPNRNDFVETPPEQQAVPERLIDFELGYRLNQRPHQATGAINESAAARQLSLEVVGYYMRYRDQLVPTGRLNDVGELVRTNVDDSYRLGLEVDAAYSINRSWTALTTLGLSRNRAQQFDEFVDLWTDFSQTVTSRTDVPLAFSPGVVANVGVQWQPEATGLAVALWGSHVGRQYLDNSGSAATRLDAYQRFDLELSYRPQLASGTPVAFTLQAQNLLNANPITNGWSYRFDSPGYDPRPDDPYAIREAGDRYVLRGSYPQAGVQVQVGVRIELR